MKIGLKTPQIRNLKSAFCFEENLITNSLKQCGVNMYKIEVYQPEEDNNFHLGAQIKIYV